MTNTIIHYGVKGMKWGVRKKEETVTDRKSQAHNITVNAGTNKQATVKVTETKYRVGNKQYRDLGNIEVTGAGGSNVSGTDYDDAVNEAIEYLDKLDKEERKQIAKQKMKGSVKKMGKVIKAGAAAVGRALKTVGKAIVKTAQKVAERGKKFLAKLFNVKEGKKTVTNLSTGATTSSVRGSPRKKKQR